MGDKQLMKENRFFPPKFIFVSNYLNHHQIPFCNAVYKILQGRFAFIQTEPMEEERVRMGWQEKNTCPYVKYFYEEPELCKELIENCDVVLFGGTDDESYISQRLKQKKAVIRYSERLYKQGQWKAVSPRGLLKKYQDHTAYRKDNVYMLCSGAYVPSDFHIVRAYPDKLLRWGYFPETRHYDVDKLMAGKQKGNILWAARFIDWKHPELPVEAAKWLRDMGCSFHMDIIGGGELDDMVKSLVSEYGLENYVTLQGYRTPEEVRGFMERADIYLVTSDRKEGWGAVVNEAMNSGCAVIGNHMIGAVPFLIKLGENGLVYRDGQEQELFAQIKELLEDREKCHSLGRNALETIEREWNAEIAAKRLSEFCLRQGFLEEKDVILESVADSEKKMPVENDKIIGDDGDWREAPKSGPCSPAPVISERKMYKCMYNNQK